MHVVSGVTKKFCAETGGKTEEQPLLVGVSCKSHFEMLTANFNFGALKALSTE